MALKCLLHDTDVHVVQIVCVVSVYLCIESLCFKLL